MFSWIPNSTPTRPQPRSLFDLLAGTILQMVVDFRSGNCGYSQDAMPVVIKAADRYMEDGDGITLRSWFVLGSSCGGCRTPRMWKANGPVPEACTLLQ